MLDPVIERAEQWSETNIVTVVSPYTYLIMCSGYIELKLVCPGLSSSPLYRNYAGLYSTLLRWYGAR